jgi:ABC-type lipoprotein export system ATPase subunit
MHPDPAIRAADVSKVFGTKVAPVHALRGVSFDVRPGERVALLGKSGSGKSTLLHLLGGLDRPSGGRIAVNGRDLAGLSADQRANYRLTTVGLVFQAYHLVPSKTALQNVELPMLFSGTPPKVRMERTRDMLASVGLAERLHHRPAELSGGERQRVALARALVNRPAILLADEPTGNLDSVTAGEIVLLLKQYLDEHGTTLMVVTHDEELARTFSDRILRLQDGRLIDS